MAVTVVSNLSLWSAADANTGWVSSGDSPAAYAGFQREGSNCLGAQISQSADHFHIPTGSGDAPGSAQNLNNTRVYAWCFPWGNIATKANGGLRIVLGDGTNRRAYYVGGTDDYGFQVGGWTCIVLDTANLPSAFAQLAGAGAPNLSAITAVGVGCNMVNKATGNVDNFYWDVVRFGLGITVYGGTSGDPGTFAQIAADDASTASGKAHGIIRQLQSGVFGVQGNITWGDNGGTNTFYFKDQDVVVVVENRVHGSGTPTDITLSVVGNSTAATQHYELGVAVGSGDTQSGRNGVQFRNANATQPVVFDASDADLDEFELYGCRFVRIRKSGSVFPKFSADATLGPNHRLSGCAFDRCGQVDLGRVPTRNAIFTGHPGTDGALLWNSNINIKNSSFIANSDVTNDPAAIEHEAAGTFAYNGLLFASNDFDIRNSVNATTQDSYGTANRDGDQQLGNGTIIGVGQSFTTNGSGGTLSSARWFLSKTGSPTGNAVAKVYAHSGVKGTSSIPTGTALATSNNVDVSTLTGTPTTTVFEFEDEVVLSASTDYVVTIEYSGGDGSNHVLVGQDSSAPSHGGNISTLTGSTWTPASGIDAVFFVETGAIVIIDATDSDPGTDTNVGSPPGATIIKNAVTVKITVVDKGNNPIEGVAVLVHDSGIPPGDTGGIVRELTDASGIATEPYNFVGPITAVVKTRKKGFISTKQSQPLGSGGLDITVTMSNDPRVE